MAELILGPMLRYVSETEATVWVALGTRSRNRAYVRDVLLQSECIDCGISDLLVLEFDHVEVKEANVSDLVRSECGLARIQAEIDRCEVRCANCHRRRTTLLRRRNATKVRAGA